MRAIALAAPGWADHHQNLVQVGSAADDIPEPLTENVDGLGLGGPKRLEEREPVSGFGSVRLIIERNGCLVEEQRRNCFEPRTPGSRPTGKAKLDGYPVPPPDPRLS
jgi:hypothetical protein